MCRVRSCLSVDSGILQVSAKFASSRRGGSELFFRKVPCWIIAGYWGRLCRRENIFHGNSVGVHIPLAFRLLRTKLTRNFPLLRPIGFWNSQILNHILHWASNFKINNRIYHTRVSLRISTCHLFRQLSLSARWLFMRILSSRISRGFEGKVHPEWSR